MIAGRPMSSSAQGFDERVGEQRARRLEADPGHRVAEQLAVLGLVDDLGVGADHLDAVFLEHAQPRRGQARC